MPIKYYFSIDSQDVTEITIDGSQVQEITIDGEIAAEYVETL